MSGKGDWKSRFRRSPKGRFFYIAEKLPPSLGRVLDVGNVGGNASPHVRLGELIEARGGILVGRDSLGDPDHKILFTPAAITNLLEQAGFAIEDMCSDAKWDIAGRSLPWVPWGRRLGSHLLVTATKT